MRGKLGRGVLAIVLLAASSSSAIAQSKEDIERALEIAYELLDRTENGKPACYTPECENSKSEILHKIHRKAQLLSFISESLEENIQNGVFGARRILNLPASQKAFFSSSPKGLREWMQVYEMRFLSNHQAEVDWLRFSNEIESLSYTIKRHQLQARSLDPIDRRFFEEVWSAGYAQALRDQREAQAYGVKREKARHAGNEALAEEYDREKLRLLLRARDWSSQNEVSIREVQRRIFPDLDMARITDICLSLQVWQDFFGAEELFDPLFLQQLSGFDKSLKELYRLVQSFNDQEYGVVGLNNFLEPVNPAIRAALEHKAQVNLEGVLDGVRHLLDTGQSLMAMSVAASLGGSSRLLQFGLLGLGGYLQEVSEMKVSKKVLPESNRIPSLEERYAYWEPRMLKRKEELVQTQEILTQKIESLEARLLMKQTEGESNGENINP